MPINSMPQIMPYSQPLDLALIAAPAPEMVSPMIIIAWVTMGTIPSDKRVKVTRRARIKKHINEKPYPIPTDLRIMDMRSLLSARLFFMAIPPKLISYDKLMLFP
jgi:hypothetical protein